MEGFNFKTKKHSWLDNTDPSVVVAARQKLSLFSVGPAATTSSSQPWQLRLGAPPTVLSKTSQGFFPVKKAVFAGIASVSNSGQRGLDF
jgi:hypothetical protein